MGEVFRASFCSKIREINSRHLSFPGERDSGDVLKLSSCIFVVIEAFHDPFNERVVAAESSIFKLSGTPERIRKTIK